MNIDNIWLDALDSIGIAWWVKIDTDRPNCTYYFGPFRSSIEAHTHKFDYVEDLQSELAEGIQVAIERCKPKVLTIDRSC